MSFRTEQKFLQEQPREVRQLKKTLPYTVSEGWTAEEMVAIRAQYQRKEELWEAERAGRYAEAKARAVAVLTGERKYKETDQDIANKRYEGLMIQETRIRIDEAREELGLTKIYDKPSLWGRLVNFFLNINFEPKN